MVVNFPLDILGGAILGLILGQIWAILFARYYGHIFDDKEVKYEN